VRSVLRAPLLATIPYVLLLNSDQVTVTTEFYGDVSGIRRIQAEGARSQKEQIRDSMPDSWLRFDREGTRISGDRVRVSRSAQVCNLDVLPDVEASALDIVQQALSLRTQYNWRERVGIQLTYANDQERNWASATTFEYRVIMPGKILSAPGAESTGNTATWTLNAHEAAEKGYDISATAVSWRWDVILVLIYVLGYGAYRIVAELAHRARLRPRKI